MTEVGVRGGAQEKNRFLKGAYIFDTYLSPDVGRSQVVKDVLEVYGDEV